MSLTSTRAIRRLAASRLFGARQTVVQGRRYAQANPNAATFNFGKMVDEAIEKQEQTTEQEMEETYWKTATEDEKRRRQTIDEAIKVRQDEEKKRVMAIKRARKQADEKDFEVISQQLLEDLDDFNAHASDPCFSQKARAAAYTLYKKDPERYNVGRLANLFRVQIDRMKLSIWFSKMEEQAEKEGELYDDTVERLLEQKYGVMDFPNEIADIPERTTWKHRTDGYMYLEPEVSSGAVMKALKHRDMFLFRESPRIPRQAIPPVEPRYQRVLSGTKQKIYPGRYAGKSFMFDISPSKNMYNRLLLVREDDGSIRTGNWQERRYIADFRRFLKYPVVRPYATPDENEPDNVPPEARVDFRDLDNMEQALKDAGKAQATMREKADKEVKTLLDDHAIKRDQPTHGVNPDPL